MKGKMSFISKLFKSKSSNSDRLVAKLTSNHKRRFLAGLSEAVRKADAGDYEGIKAMREALRIRSGKKDITLYETETAAGRGAGLYLGVRTKILELVKTHALLNCPELTGDLISTAMRTDETEGLLDEIFKIGKPSDGYVFQLFYNELQCTARFNFHR